MPGVAIDRATVVHTAHLARLRLSEDEIDRLAVELGRICESVALLVALDTTGVPEARTPVVTLEQLRADVPGDSLAPAAALQGAPDEADGCFRVPGALDG